MNRFRSRNKFNAVRANGFGSKLESAVHDILLLREKTGEIKEIKCQVPVLLQDGDKKTRISWRVDFAFTDTKTDKTIYCEAKGMADQNFKLKLRIYRKVRREKLEIWMGLWKRPFLAEIVNP